jgi:hypothetical protein
VTRSAKSLPISLPIEGLTIRASGVQRCRALSKLPDGTPYPGRDAATPAFGTILPSSTWLIHSLGGQPTSSLKT